MTKFGLYCSAPPDGSQIHRCIQEMLAEGRTAEKCGSHGMIFGEHQQDKDGLVPSPLLLAATVASQMNLEVGTSVVGDAAPAAPPDQGTPSVYREEARVHGRPAVVPLMRDAWVAESRSAAREQYEEHLRGVHRCAMTRQAVTVKTTTEEISLDDLVRDRLIFGNSQECMEQLRMWKPEVQPDYINFETRGGAGSRACRQGHALVQRGGHPARRGAILDLTAATCLRASGTAAGLGCAARAAFGHTVTWSAKLRALPQRFPVVHFPSSDKSMNTLPTRRVTTASINFLET